MDNDNGGFAFPSSIQFGCTNHAGMGLRDYFAAKAMASLIGLTNDRLTVHDCVVISHDAYYMADAMLAARKE